MTDTPGPFNLRVEPARTVHERMIAVLAELPAIGKDQRNEQQQFMFRGHDDILNALNPLLAKHGVYVVPAVLDRATAQRATQRGGVMYEVNLHVMYRFYGAGGDYIEASTWGEGTDSGDKATNKAMTMAFKNVLSQAFAISSAENVDSDAETPEETTGREGAPPRQLSAEERPASPGQMDEISGVIRLLQEGYPHAADEGKTWKQTAWLYAGEKLGIPPSGELTVKQANELREWLEETYRALNDDVPFDDGSAEDIPFGEEAQTDEAAAAADRDPDPEEPEAKEE